MLKLLQLMFLGHTHKYDIKEVRDIRGFNKWEQKCCIGQSYILLCKTCGKIKHTSVRW